MASAVTQEVYQWHNGAIIGRPDTSWLNASRRCGMDVETGPVVCGKLRTRTRPGVRRTEHLHIRMARRAIAHRAMLIPHATEVTGGHSCLHLAPTRPLIGAGRAAPRDVRYPPAGLLTGNCVIRRCLRCHGACDDALHPGHRPIPFLTATGFLVPAKRRGR